MLHDGPVPAGLDAAQLAGVRARYLAGVSGQDAAEVERSLVERDRALTTALGGERLTLWLEHDLYDQLQLLQVLDRVAGAPDRRAEVRLAQADDYLGTMGDAALRRLGEDAAPVEEDQLEIAAAAWKAFRAPTPAPLVALLERDLGTLPFLRDALLRLLEELPAPGTGLSRTERQILELLSVGPSTPKRLFAECGAREAARFLGDLPFFQRLQRLGCSPPLVEGLAGRHFAPWAPRRENLPFLDKSIHISEIGRLVLSGEQDLCELHPPDRWQGGTRLGPDNLWRWDAAGGRLL
jgi:hypothetical protein